jgi:hypothetical protein
LDLAELVQTVPRRCAAVVAEHAREALTKTDCIQSSGLLIALRAAAGYFGPSGAFELAGELEALARGGDLTQAGALFTSLEQEIQQLLRTIGELYPLAAGQKAKRLRPVNLPMLPRLLSRDH